MAHIYVEMVIFAVMIKVRIINKGHHQLPEYATPQSAGMDLRADNTEADATDACVDRTFYGAACRL